MTWLILPGLVLAVYLGLAISIYRNQDRLLYIPTTYDLQVLQDGCQTRDLMPWPTRDEQYLGLVSSDRHKSTAGTVLVFHGNAGTALGRDYYVQALAPPRLSGHFGRIPGLWSQTGNRWGNAVGFIRPTGP